MDEPDAFNLHVFIERIFHESSGNSSVTLVFLNLGTLEEFKKIVYNRLSISYINFLQKVTYLHLKSHIQLAQFLKDKISSNEAINNFYGFCDFDSSCHGSPATNKIIQYLLGRLMQMNQVNVYVNDGKLNFALSSLVASDLDTNCQNYRSKFI